MLGRSKSAVFFKFVLRDFLAKSNHSQDHRRTCQGNRTKGYHYYEGRVYKSKKASVIPSSVKKALLFLTQSYGWKVAQRKFDSVYSEIKKGNFKNQGLV